MQLPLAETLPDIKEEMTARGTQSRYLNFPSTCTKKSLEQPNKIVRHNVLVFQSLPRHVERWIRRSNVIYEMRQLQDFRIYD